jgi:hypothetical protein
MKQEHGLLENLKTHPLMCVQLLFLPYTFALTRVVRGSTTERPRSRKGVKRWRTWAALGFPVAASSMSSQIHQTHCSSKAALTSVTCNACLLSKPVSGRARWQALVEQVQTSIRQVTSNLSRFLWASAVLKSISKIRVIENL